MFLCFVSNPLSSFKKNQNIRYVVVGLGHIAQVGVLPAFFHAKENSELVGLVSGDPTKRKVLSKRYKVPAYTYEQYEQCLKDTECVDVWPALSRTR